MGLAGLFPDKNFIGVDIKGARMWTGAKQSFEAGMTNVAFLRTVIELIDRFFAPGEVSEIWITFPDPQMKKATKRLTSTFFMERYRRILKPGGKIHLKTDSNFLFTYTCAMVDHNGLPVEFRTDDLYASGDADHILSIKTHYEAQWLERGKSIKYIVFNLPADGELTEPNIEIELDDYRSYGRTKRSNGTCCDGVNSTYNIVCGRSTSPTGPFIDNVGRDMIEGGGKMVLGARDGYTGAGHFGRYIIEDGVEKMSFHWEADYYQSGRSTLAILPIVWRNGWPEAGYNVKPGVYEIESERRGYALEIATEYVRLGGGRGMFGGGGNQPNTVVPFQKLEDVIGNWPKGNIDVRVIDYQFRPNQKWEFVAMDEGTLGTPYYKIVIAGTNRALAATAGKELTTVPEFTGAPEQLWSVDQLTDGTYRICPKAVPGTDEKVCLISVGDSNASLGKFDINDVNCKWNLRQY